jgi:glutamine synthetase
LIKYSPELCYFYAPTINAYKRYQPGSWAPTRMAWSHDNRTVGFRVVGNAEFISHREPDARRGCESVSGVQRDDRGGFGGSSRRGLDAGDEYRGNAYVDPKLAALPSSSLESAAGLLRKEPIGEAGVYGRRWWIIICTARSWRVKAFNNSVTDWEKVRYFERI